MISVNDVVKIVGNGSENLTILDGVSLDINNSEFLSICGSSGCGKSTLISIIAGIDKPNSGNIIIDGIDIYSLKHNQLAEFRNQNIGIVFQKSNLISSLSVLENVEMPQYLAKKGSRSNNCAKDILELLGLGDKLNRKIKNLSGGEQQRIAIARAFIQNPKIIMADEPTGSLDYKNKNIIISLLKKIQIEFNITIILVTHDKEVAQLADRIVFLEKGKVALASN